MKILSKKSAPLAPIKNCLPLKFRGGCNYINYAGYKGAFFARPSRPRKKESSCKTYVQRGIVYNCTIFMRKNRKIKGNIN